MEHFDFLEKIAEGFVIEAYNSKKKNASDQIDLYAYNLQIIERALAELRGEEPPSSGAQNFANQNASTLDKHCVLFNSQFGLLTLIRVDRVTIRP